MVRVFCPVRQLATGLPLWFIGKQNYVSLMFAIGTCVLATSFDLTSNMFFDYFLNSILTVEFLT